MTAVTLRQQQRSQDHCLMVRNRIGPRRGVKIHRSYKVEEVARLLNVSKRTVRRWIKAGLAAITDQKPILILGEDLLAFLAARKQRSRRCQPEECYCVKCREPRRPAGDMAEFIRLTIKTGNLRAICPVCGSLMHKRIRCDAVEALGRVLDVTVAQAAPSLAE
jgi:excisionase family DNA binding protein